MSKKIETIDGVVEFLDSGFDVNLNNMIKDKQYVFSFEDSKYVILKNRSDELVMTEIA